MRDCEKKPEGKSNREPSGRGISGLMSFNKFYSIRKRRPPRSNEFDLLVIPEEDDGEIDA